jgi:membrane-bound metal-dependent hydrolase YbcI (DUF457 family)
VASASTGKYLSEFGLGFIGHKEFLPISWVVAFVSAAIGTFSHVLLDSVMHHDVEPFWPLTPDNALVGVISIQDLQWVCIGSGLAGAVLYLVLASRLAKRNNSLQARRP